MHLKKQHLEPDMKLGTGSKLGMEYVKAVYCHCAYLTYMQSTSWEMLGWMNHKLESIRQGEILITSDIQLKSHSDGRKPTGAKEPLNEGERGERKAGLKLNIQKTKIMAYSPIISQQIDGETMETVTDFIFLGSKITADCDCSHEIKRHLYLSWWRSHLQYRRPWLNSWVWKTHWRRERLPTPVSLGLPSGSAGEESTYSVGVLG